MSPQQDSRRQVGASVLALAMHVTSEAECGRRYGSLKKTKMLTGTVVSVDIDRSGRRANCFLVIDFDLGGNTIKRKRLNIRSVKAAIHVTPATPAISAVKSAQNTAQPDRRSEVERPRQEEDEAYSTDDVQNNPAFYNSGQCYNIHGTIWQAPTNNEETRPVGGPYVRRTFGIRTVTGEVISADSDYSQRTPIDYFLMVFPPGQLQEMVRLTNVELYKLNISTTTAGELLKFVGILILCTRFEFGERRSLWSKEPLSKYMPAPNFGKTGMSRSRFDALFRCVRFSQQPEQRGELSSEQFRWKLVDDFVTRINEHRESHIIPSHLLCVDELIARWYGQGGDWINHGLPMYIAIERKPENGCEIQNAACGISGVMLRLKLVKTAEEEGSHLNEDDDGLLHGTKVLKELVPPWAQSHRVVCADSYFASVTAARELKRMGLRFIGVVKTATTHFPMKELSSIETTERGACHCFVERKGGNTELMAMVWDRRYFIMSASSLASGTPYTRKRWRQIDYRINAPPERVELTVFQPQAAELYYSACARIDRHNRCRQADLALEKKIGTLNWSMRVNTSILAMCIVDAWLAFKTCKGHRCVVTQKQFYNELLVELIDNSFDVIGSRERQDIVKESAVIVNGVPRSGIDLHLTPTKRRRLSKGMKTSNLQQGRCRVCKAKTTKECSECRDSDMNGWICDTKRGKNCFAVHLSACHNI